MRASAVHACRTTPRDTTRSDSLQVHALLLSSTIAQANFNVNEVISFLSSYMTNYDSDMTNVTTSRLQRMIRYCDVLHVR